MNILSITSILPVPGIIKSNDFVFQTWLSFQKLHPEAHIVIIRPLKIDLKPKALLRYLSGRSNVYGPRKINGFPVEVMPFLSSWGFRNLHSLITSTLFWFNRGRFKYLFDKYSFDLIHAQYIFPDTLLAAKLKKKYQVPYVVTTHNERFYFQHLVSRHIAIRLLQKASAIFPINHSNFRYYQEQGLKHVKLIPLGFSESFVRNQSIAPTEQIKVLTVCELIPLKNVDKVIEAIAQLSGKYKMRYTVIGKGPQRKKLEALTHSLGVRDKVVFIEHIAYDEIAEEMYKHDIFIMPSYFETFGRVYFEAMAMGIPVICAKNSGIYGIFKENEEGFSVDHHSVPEMVAVLELLINNPSKRKRVGMEGKKLVEQYTWSGIASLLHSEYSKILNSNQ